MRLPFTFVASLLLPWLTSAAPTTSSSSLGWDALRTVIDNNAVVSSEELIQLGMVNKELRQLVSEQPRWRYLINTVADRKCLDKFAYNPQRPFTEAITYTFNYTADSLVMEHLLDLDAKCLNRLAAAGIPFAIRVDNESSQEERILYRNFLLKGILITTYRGSYNCTFAKRLLLLAATRNHYSELTEYLLSSSNQHEEVVVGKELLAEVIYDGNEQLFKRLVQPIQSDTSLMQQLLTLDIPNRHDVIQDVLGVALMGYDPSNHLLEYLLSFLTLQPRHLYGAALYGRLNALMHLLPRAKIEMPHLHLQTTLLDTLEAAAQSGMPFLFMTVFDEIEIGIDDWKRELILKRAMESQSVEMVKTVLQFLPTPCNWDTIMYDAIATSSIEVVDYLRRRYNVPIRISHIRGAMFFQVGTGMIVYLLNQCSTEELEWISKWSDLNMINDEYKESLVLLASAILETRQIHKEIIGEKGYTNTGGAIAVER